MSQDENASANLKCPVCRKAAAQHYRPFCSKRCADIDLGRWVSGGYVIPGRTDDDAANGDLVPESGEDSAEER